MEIKLLPIPSDLDQQALQSFWEQAQIAIFNAFRLPPELLMDARENRNVAANVAEPKNDTPDTAS
jgi:hypothetical protein